MSSRPYQRALAAMVAGLGCLAPCASSALASHSAVDRVSAGPFGGNNGAYPASLAGGDAFDSLPSGVSKDGTRMVFFTQEKLTSNDNDSNANDLYQLDQNTNPPTVSLVTPGTLGSPTYVGLSDDGTRVFFQTSEKLDPINDTDFESDLYERNTSSGTTTLVSEGGNGPFSAGFNGASADGTAVVFSTSEPLAGGDTDSQSDLYLRSGGTTTRISRGEAACEPACGNAGAPATFDGLSQDGSKVFFSSVEQLTSDDSDGSSDVYVRDTSAGATTRVSRGAAACEPACGNAAVPGPAFAAASQDGNKVFFQASGNDPYTPDDTDASSDIYVRDIGAGTTVRASRGPTTCEPACGNGAFPAELVGAAGHVSQNANHVFFRTDEPLTSDDSDTATDLYKRDLTTSTTSRVSRGTSTCEPGCGNNSSFGASFGNGVQFNVSADGSRAFFHTSEGLVASDTDGGQQDAYERNTVTGTTTLISPGAGTAPVYFGGASKDGLRAAVVTQNGLTVEDTDGFRWDGYEWSNGILTLGSKGPAAKDPVTGRYPGPYDVNPYAGGASEDGSRVYFETTEGLVSEDSDFQFDVYYAGVDSVRQTLPAGGGQVSTGSNPTPADPLETTLTTPSSGIVSITEQTTSTTPPSGYGLLGWQVDVTAPAAPSTLNPLVLEFVIDGSLLPNGYDESQPDCGAAVGLPSQCLQAFKNAIQVGACAGGANEAFPNPCYRRSQVGGPGTDLTVKIYTMTASSWNFGLPNGTIVIVKDSAPDDQQDFAFTTFGHLSPTSFSLDDDGDPMLSNTRTFSNVTPGGGYQVNETVPSGWDQTSATCSDGSPVTDIDVRPGEVVTCTFTNRKRGRIVVRKDAQPNDEQDFAFSAGGGLSPTSFSLDDDSNAMLSNERSFDDVAPGNGYSLSETVPSGWTQASATCDDGSPVSNIDVSAGETVTCTFTNTKKGRVVVRKDAQPNDEQDFGFSAGGGLSPTSFSLDDDSDATLSNELSFDNLDPGSGYSLSETVPSGWNQTGATCDDGSPVSNIDVSAGETVTCTFVNQQAYPRPNGAAKTRLTLVPAHLACTSPDTDHGAPFPAGAGNDACTSTGLETDNLTVPNDDSSIHNGSVTFRFRCGNGGIPPSCGAAGDQAEAVIITTVNDVRCAATASGSTPCGASNTTPGADYTGSLLLRLPLRITDRYNGASTDLEATLTDADFTVGIACTASPGDLGRGSGCSLNTTTEALVPDFVREDQRALMALGQVSMLDMGDNGTLATGTIAGPAGVCPPACKSDGDEQAFLRQGIFVP